MYILSDKELEILNNIYETHLIDILENNTLSIFFIRNFILNEDFQLLDSEGMIDVSIIKLLQPHIDIKELENMEIDEDFVNRYVNFERYMNNNSF